MIASMVTDAKLLVEGYLGQLNDKQQEKLGRSIRKGEYLLSLIQDFLNLSRLEDISLKATILPNVHLEKQVVEPAIEFVETEVEANEMMVDRIIADDLPTIACDVGLMQIALGNLLRNAVKYGRKHGKLRIIAEKKDDMLCLSVWNEGPGFSNSQRAELFQKFSRLDDPELRKEKGTGIGLYSTWRIMQLHRGHVTARSQQGSWAEFTLSLPIVQVK